MSGTNTTAAGPKGLAAAYEIKFAADPATWREARALLGDPRFSVSRCAELLCSDPAIVLEFLRASSSMFYSEGKPPVGTMKAAIERLGATPAIETLEAMKDFPAITNPEVSKWFEVFRFKGKRAGIVSKILAEIILPPLVEDCMLAGSLLYIGDMLAVAYFTETYAMLAKDMPRSKVLYKLEKEYQCNVEKLGYTYLRKTGIPELVYSVLDESVRIKTPTRTPMRPLLAAVTELMAAFDSEKWEKMAPGSNLPPKSALRIIKMTDQQYSHMFERVGGYLMQERMKLEVS